MSSERLVPRRGRPWAALALAVLAVAGCAPPPGPIFVALDPPLRWPPPPAAPRVEYVGALSGDRDLKRARTLGETIFGEENEQRMRSPYALCTDGGDRLFVCDGGTASVHVFDLASRRHEQWTGPEGGFVQPLGVAWDADRARLLVCDAEAAHVVVLDEAGRSVAILGAGAFVRPSGVAVEAGTGRIFVADAGAHQVVVLAAGGTVERRIGSRGAVPGRFNFPTNVALGRDGALYVADTLNFRVQVFDAALEPIRVVGGHGDAPGYFSHPKGLALDQDDNLHVVDSHFESIQIFDDAGRLLLTFGREGRAPGEFWLPAGIHIDERDRIWIADSYNRRVQVFRRLAETESRTEDDRP